MSHDMTMCTYVANRTGSDSRGYVLCDAIRLDRLDGVSQDYMPSNGRRILAFILSLLTEQTW